MPPKTNPRDGAPGGGKLGGKLSNRDKAIGAAVAGGLALIVYMRSRSSSSGSSSSTSPTGTVSYADNSGTYDSLEAQISRLQSQIGASSPGGTPTPAPSPAPKPKPKPKPKKGKDGDHDADDRNGRPAHRVDHVGHVTTTTTTRPNPGGPRKGPTGIASRLPRRPSPIRSKLPAVKVPPRRNVKA